VRARAAGARREAGTGTIGGWAFAGVAISSFGGPLALAALSAPALVADAGLSAGLATLVAGLVFVAPLAIWLRYSRYVSSSGGLYSFVEAAAGRRVALAQAGIWTVSYLLYLVYTTVQIVYDLLPQVVPGERHYQTLLALLIPVAVAGVMVAGRTVALVAIGVIAAGQLALVGILDGVTLAHLSTPPSSFTAGAPTGAVAKAGAQTSLLYICGSLPLFLGGELARPAHTIRRGLIGTFVLTAALVVAAVAPLAAAPGLLHTQVPGVAVIQQFAGQGLGQAVGIGVAVSIGGVILCEYLALSRLLHAVSRRSVRSVTAALGAVLVLVAPFTLIDPEGFYSTLIKPSLIALWLSQLIVFAVYPRFAVKYRQRVLSAWIFSVVACAFALYGLWTTLQTTVS
jgi:amino acid transporter